jgi:hypothetical protein
MRGFFANPRVAALATVIATAAAGFPNEADAADRFRLAANGIYNTSTLSFSDTRQYTAFAETARVVTDTSVDGGFGGDVSLTVRAYKRLGVLAGYSFTSRQSSGSFEASIPHPLFLNRPRTLSGDFSGFDYKEGAVHLDLAYLGGGGGAFAWVVFGGASFFQVEADLVDDVVYDQSYPYDAITLDSVTATTAKESPVGFNLGLSLDYRFGASRRFGVGAMGRYSKATVTTRATSDATEVSFDAGGFEVGAGIRIYF